MDKPKYKLLKDLPVGKAGDIVFDHRGDICFKQGALICSTGLSADLLAPSSDWFEIVEDPKDGRWAPQYGEEYWYINDYGETESVNWTENEEDIWRYQSGAVYRTERKCVQARECILAEVRLRQTSTLNPDPKNGNGGYVVYYDHRSNSLRYCSDFFWCNIGIPIRYAGVMDAEKSIKENRKDWLIYFGIEEEE